MVSVAMDLDWCQQFLKDTFAIGTDGETWSRAELLGYYNDGYRDLVKAAGASRQWTVLEVPPQSSYAGTYAWERRYASSGTFLPCTQTPSAQFAVMALFEIGITTGAPSMAFSGGVTQGWERSFSNPAYTPFRFRLPRNHLRVVKMWYGNRLLFPLSAQELDWTYQNWYSLGNFPLAWVTGSEGQRTYELYEIQTVDTHPYALIRDSWLLGTLSDGSLRAITGLRTYGATIDPNMAQPASIGFAWTCEGDAAALRQTNGTFFGVKGDGLRLTGDPTTGNVQGIHRWETALVKGTGSPAAGENADTAAISCFAWEARYGAQSIALALGAARAIESPNRQYWPVVAWHDQLPLGKIDDVHSSDALMVLEEIEPDAPALLPGDRPGLIPAQLQKYLRYYVLYRAFDRQGRGYMPVLASIWEARFAAGARVLRVFADIQRRNKTYARKPVVTRGRPPRPHLPSGYPSLWGT